MQPYSESKVLLLLDDSFGNPFSFTEITFIKTENSLEWLLCDLALSLQSIPSLTLANLTLLSPALDSHSTSVIVTQSSFLATLLEHLAERAEEGDRSPHIIVVGEESTWGVDAAHKAMFNLASFDSVESAGSPDMVPAHQKNCGLLSFIYPYLRKLIHYWLISGTHIGFQHLRS